MSIREEFKEIEEKVKDALEKLGADIRHIHYPESLFGKHSYPVEWSLLKFALFDITRGVSILDPTIVVGLPPEVYSKKEREKLVTKLLSRAKRTLEDRIGV